MRVLISQQAADYLGHGTRISRLAVRRRVYCERMKLCKRLAVHVGVDTSRQANGGAKARSDTFEYIKGVVHLCVPVTLYVLEY
jgi:hypothetical protein